MLGAIRYNLRHLLDFSGRDARPTFWYYVLFAVVLNFAASVLIMVPAMVQAVSEMMAAMQAGATPEQANAMMAANLTGITTTSILAGTVLGFVNLLLLAAAFVRRLHDAGRTGWWAGLIGALYALILLRTLSRIEELEAMTRDAIANASTGTNIYAANPGLALDSLIGWVPLLLLIGFGVLKSTDGPNRFGAEPVRF